MKKILLIFLLANFMFACQNKTVEEKSIDKSFESFLTKFNNDSIFQKSRVKFPLPIIEMDGDNFNEVHNKLEKKDYSRFDLTSNKVHQKEEGFTQEIKLNKNKATIEIRGIENGIMTDYYFEKINGKWMFIGLKDAST